ncbi:MAG: PadR family transcriptional regulator [Actinobacteria bacterium HGW-Actinobacteria-4]|nr:MAG: PadR family transcriptional regulator [Actinobacteria bacterium HGW-Actinobacteria-4]
MWEAMDQIRANVEMRVNTRMGKGDVRAAILTLLVDEPMHGYQIIRQIEERSGGTWKPSAGSVYPTLQLLADEGLVSVETANDRKVYSLTEEGKEVADASHAPWESTHHRESMGFSGLPKAGVDLAQVITHVMRSGSAKQQEQAVEVLDEARRKIYTILAND